MSSQPSSPLTLLAASSYPQPTVPAPTVAGGSQDVAAIRKQLSVFGSANWIHDIRGKQLRESEFEQQLGPTYQNMFGVYEEECVKRRARSRSKSKSPRRRRDSPQAAAANSKRRYLRDACTSRSSSSPSSSSSSLRRGSDKDQRPLLEIEKLLQGGLAQAYSTSARFQQPDSTYKNVNSSSAVVAGGGPFSLFPPRYSHPAIRRARYSEERKIAAVARKEQMRLEELNREMPERRLRSAFSPENWVSLLKAISRSQEFYASASRRAVQDVIGTSLSSPHRVAAPLPSSPPSILKPASPPSSGLRLFPDQFSAAEIQQFAHNNNNSSSSSRERSSSSSREENGHENFSLGGGEKKKKKNYRRVAAESDALSWDRNIITQKALSILESVDTPDQSDGDLDAAEALDDELYQAQQLYYIEQERAKLDRDEAAISAAAGDGDVATTAAFGGGGDDPQRDRGFSASGSSTQGRSVVAVKLSVAKPVSAYLDDDGQQQQQQEQHQRHVTINGNPKVHDDHDAIGSLLLQKWHNYHAHDVGYEARKAYDKSMLETILKAGSAEEARKMVLMDIKK